MNTNTTAATQPVWPFPIKRTRNVKMEMLHPTLSLDHYVDIQVFSFFFNDRTPRTMDEIVQGVLVSLNAELKLNIEGNNIDIELLQDRIDPATYYFTEDEIKNIVIGRVRMDVTQEDAEVSMTGDVEKFFYY